jgi:hypothetical protein
MVENFNTQQHREASKESKKSAHKGQKAYESLMLATTCRENFIDSKVDHEMRVVVVAEIKNVKIKTVIDV